MSEAEEYERWMKFYRSEDRYWRLSSQYVDPSRLRSQSFKFEKMKEEHPKWTDDILSGLPSYYAILGVTRETLDEIDEAYELKLKHSIYGDELKEAYETLRNDEMRRKYDNFLRNFSKISRSFNPVKKSELVRTHEKYLGLEEKIGTFGFIQEKHKGWIDLFLKGAPTLYEILGIDRSTKDLEYLRLHRKFSDLEEEAYKILSDPELRWKYDFVLDFLANVEREKWEGSNEDILRYLRQ